MKSKVVTRFAPSPTGYLHIGGLRTALFSYLWAKHNKGHFKLRIEDTDQKRAVENADAQLIAILKEFGLQHDGEIMYQSERANSGLYKKVAEQLIANGDAYYCFCTPEELDEERKSRIARKEPPGYSGTCRALEPKDAQKRVNKGEQAVIRIKWPDKKNKEIIFDDRLHGNVSFSSDILEDTIILKSDGFPTYHLAHVIDDHESGVTDVIRGEEWLPSAPLHQLIYTALKYDLPNFWHVPLILNPDKSKLSKRQGDVAVEDFLAKGYLKAALINYIAFLGWNPGTDRELFTLKDLIEEFDAKKINTSGAIFDIQKLNWYNSEYIKNDLAALSDDDLFETIIPFLPAKTEKKDALAIFGLFFERIHALSELTELSEFLRRLPSYDSALLIFKKSTIEKTKAGLKAALTAIKNFKGEWSAINLELALKEEMERQSLSFGDVFWPVRVALSGLAASPSPTDILNYLGKDASLDRIEKALVNLAKK